MSDDLIIAIARLEQEIDRLRKENAALRREVLDQGHANAILRGKCRTCEYHPRPELDRA
jgi:hypothetical protein